MSRVAKNPVAIPKGVDINISESQVSVKGPKGNLELDLHPAIGFEMDDGSCQVKWNCGQGSGHGRHLPRAAEQHGHGCQ